MLSGYESNLIKLMVECLDKHTTELKNLNTNLNTLNNNLTTLNANLGVKLDDLSNKIYGLTGQFDTFNGRFNSCLVVDEQGRYWFRVWLPNS